MANKSTKRPIRVSYSKRNQDGSYTPVSSLKEATGFHVHRNDASPKKFKATVEAIAAKIDGFVLNEKNSDAKRSMFVRQTSETAEELLEQLESDAPF